MSRMRTGHREEGGGGRDVAPPQKDVAAKLLCGWPAGWAALEALVEKGAESERGDRNVLPL